MQENFLQNWVFTKNTYSISTPSGEWMCTDRDHYMDLFSNIYSQYVFRSSNIDTLIYMISKGDGDINKVIEFSKKAKV